MKLMILFIAVWHITAVSLVSVEYNGFNNCGFGGWKCDDDDLLYYTKTVTFDCSLSGHPNTRIWIWTARLPNSVTKFVVQNCRVLELHVDCTSQSRSATIQEFRAINITEMIILKPTPSFVYLHDNAPIPHLPPVFHLENVRTRFYSGLVSERNPECKYNSETMREFVMKNVTVDDIPSRSISNASVDRLLWSNVRIRQMSTDAMSFNGSAEFRECHFEHPLPSKAIDIEGQDVMFLGNTFPEIYPGAISAYSYNFNFSYNTIGDLLAKGLVVSSSLVSIQGNVIENMEKNALAGVSPVFYAHRNVFKISYTFTGNQFINLSPLSLHCDWKSYSSTCSTIVIDGNKFDCSCVNLLWIRDFLRKNDANHTDIAGFYEKLLQTTHHCSTSVNCTLSSILNHVCENATLSSQCTGLKENEVMERKVNVSFNFENTEEDIIVDWNATSVQNVEEADNNDPPSVDKTYYVDRVSEVVAVEYVPVVVTVFAILFLAVILTAFLVWFYRKRRHRGAVEIYRYDKNNDAEILITNPSDLHPTENENTSFHNFSG